MQKPWSVLGLKTGLRWVQDGHKMGSKKSAKKNELDYFGFFFGAFLGAILGSILGSDRPKTGQDEPKRAIRSFKEPKSCIFKNLKKPSVFSVFGSRGFPREPQEAREGSQETPKETPKGGPKLGQKVAKNCNQK